MSLSAAQARLIEGIMNRPWRAGAQGPDAFDCWGLVCWASQNLFERSVPYVPGAPMDDIKALQLFLMSHPAHRQWNVTEAPVHGGLVEMGHNLHPFHMGVWLDVDGGGVLHCHVGAGVTFDRLLCLRVSGWRRFIYYDWAGA